MTGRDPLDGMARPPEAAHSLVDYMLGAAWPWFLEGVFFWQHADRLSVAYRDLRRRIDPWSPSWASRGRAG